MRTTLPTTDAVWQQPLAQHVRRELAQFSSEQRFVVACSGGRDSLVLADLMAEYAAGRVRLLHVNHQLQAGAADWAQQVQTWAQRRGLACAVCRVEVAAGNLEAQARQARYQVFTHQVQSDEVLVLAHHQQDQAETLLMRLFTGSGVQGLAAMRALVQREGLRLWRPLLGYTRQGIEAWAQLRELPFIDDPANQIAHYDRVYLRQTLWPVLQARWPSVEQTIGRSAALLQDAAEILAEVVAQDLRACQSPDGLSVLALQQLSAARQRQLIAHWMQGEQVYAPPLQRVLAVVQLAELSKTSRVEWQAWQFRYYQHQLYRLPLSGTAMQDRIAEIQLAPFELQLGQTLSLGSTKWQVIPSVAGLPLGILKQPLRVRARMLGERLHLEGRVGHWPVKKILQHLHIPIWQRDQIAILEVLNSTTVNQPLALLTPKGCLISAEFLQQQQPSWRLQRV